MAQLTTQVITRLGIAPTYAAATAGGDTCECGQDVFLHVKNTTASAITVSLVAPAAKSPYVSPTFGNSSKVCPATTGDIMIGPINAQVFGDPVTGQCLISYGGVGGATVAVIKLQED